MVNGKRVGDENGYYENGKSKYLVKYNDGNKILQKSYHPNGQLSYEANYKDGSRDGIAKRYYPNGNIKSIIEYKSIAGVESGLRWNALESFNSDGSLREHGSLLDGNGTLISYDDNGEVTKIVEYQGGVEVNQIK